MPARHTLNAERANLHGHFSPDLPPALTIDAGDTVEFQCLDSGWGLEEFRGFDVPQRKVEPRHPVLDDGHCLTGPVYIRGAKPGMTLAVHINAIDVGSWGTVFAGGFSNDWNDRLGIGAETTGIYHAWTLDRETGMGRNQYGHVVKLRPFMGVYGMPPAEPGIHPTPPPRMTGGNIDCKELIAGTTLYLPIAVEGGLFSVGDGHAVQGDGEVSVTAIECPMDRVEITFELLDDMPLSTPIAHTPSGWVTLGFHRDLNEATVLALEAMLVQMKRLYSLEHLDALALASLVVDMRVTQVVNGVRGVHAVLPDGAIGQA